MSTQNPHLARTYIQDEDILDIMDDQPEGEAPEGELLAPTLSQSRQRNLACAPMYAAISQTESRSSIPALRGSEIHAFMAEYLNHCVEKKLRSDWEFFDAEVSARSWTTDDAVEIILPNLRDTLIDPDEVLHIEKRLYLGRNFEPLNGPDGAHYDGKPDLVLIRGTRAIIPDWKSQFKIEAATTFQGKFYSLLILAHYDFVTEVEFELHFVRYGAVRSVIYQRDQLPNLKRAAESARKRQLEIEAIIQGGIRGSALQATPGPHCIYCPLLHSGCPIQGNEYATTPEDALRNIVWAQQFLDQNKRILVPAIVKDGFVQIRDNNGDMREAKYIERNKSAYYLGPTAQVVAEYIKATGDDISGKLKIGATELNSLAKAQKRKALADGLATVKVVTKETVLSITGVEEDRD